MENSTQWDPESTAGIIEHMNEDHADAVGLYLKAFGNTDVEPSIVKMTAIDAHGIHLNFQSAEGEGSCTIKFADAGVKSPLSDLSESRAALVSLVGKARKKLNV